MFARSNIRKITIAVPRDFHSEVYLALGKAGIVHLTRCDGKIPLCDADLEKEEALTRQILSGAEHVLNTLHREPQATTGILPTPERLAFVVETKEIVDRAMSILARLVEQSEAIERRIACAEAMGQMGIDPAGIGKARFVKTIFATVDKTETDVPSCQRFAITGAGGYVFGVSLPQDFPAMLEFLKARSFTDHSSDIPEVALEQLLKRARDLKRRKEILDGRLKDLKERRGPVLDQLRNGCLTYLQVLKAERMALFSTGVMFLSGWIDLRDKERLVALLKQI